MANSKSNRHDVFSSTNVLKHLYYVAYPQSPTDSIIVVFDNQYTAGLEVTEENLDDWIMIKNTERARFVDVARDTDIQYPGEVFVVSYKEGDETPTFERYYTYEEFIRKMMDGDIQITYNMYTDTIRVIKDGRVYLPFKTTAQGRSLYSELISTRHFENDEDNKNYIYRRMFTLRGALFSIGLKGIDVTYTKNRVYGNEKKDIIKRLYGYRKNARYNY